MLYQMPKCAVLNFSLKNPESIPRASFERSLHTFKFEHSEANFAALIPAVGISLVGDSLAVSMGLNASSTALLNASSKPRSLLKAQTKED